MIENEFNDRDCVIAQCKAKKKKNPGSIWNIKVLDKKGIVNLVTVLKIDHNEYRFFDDPSHAESMRMLRGLDNPTAARPLARYRINDKGVLELHTHRIGARR